MRAIEIDVEVMNADASDAIENLCYVCRRLMVFDCWLQTFLVSQSFSFCFDALHEKVELIES